MDGITQALQAIQPALKVGGEVAGVGSTAYNMYNQYQNQQYQNKLRSFAQDPAKMNQYAAQFTQPLNAGLQTGVANAAQADLATRGLTDSPEISQQVYAQAIAPYIQQNQQQGYQNAIQALGLGGGAVNPNNSSPNTISALAKMFAGQTAPADLSGASALTRIQQLAASGAAPQTTPYDMGDMSIPYQPMQQFDAPAQDLSSYTPTTLEAGAGWPDYTAGLNYASTGVPSF